MQVYALAQALSGTQVESIYGDDIAKVSTEEFIHKATISNPTLFFWGK